MAMKFTNQHRLVKKLKHIKHLIAKINRTQTPKANKRNKPMFETHKKSKIPTTSHKIKKTRLKT